ncbi:MAG: hypothetical protein ACK5KN_05535 [Dysgonomonas sp.]|uniref:hypothetical protein n=1 Tax=Dysgonomonas sp. TaxID=1891233 RepID=UPI003A853989
MELNVGLFSTTRNQRVLVFLLPKAAKGTKNALAPRFKGRLVGLKDETEKLALKVVKYELADKLKHVSVFSSFNPTGTPSMKLTAQADARIGAKLLHLICVSFSALVTQAGYPHGAAGLERDGAIAHLSLSAGKTVLAPSPFGEGGG